MFARFGDHLKLELVQLHPVQLGIRADWCADVNDSHQEYGISGDGLDR
jgi:hypothetical protein